jgi:hypothetical protein
MGVTLDSLTLTVLKWQEALLPIMTMDDKWIGGLCKRVPRVYGAVRTYQLDCAEQNVAWASSQVNHFEQVASAGTAVAFTSDLPIRAISSTSVYVMGVNFAGENLGTQNIRNFTLQLQET